MPEETELQPAAPESNIQLSEPEAPPESPAGEGESAPSGDETPEKVTFSDEQQKVVDGIVGKKVYHTKEAERRAESLQKENDDLRRQLPQEARPEIPVVPDRYDFDSDDQYLQSINNRDAQIAGAAAFDARQSQANEQAAQAQARTQFESDQAQMEQVKTYAERAEKLGVKPAELQAAGQLVANMGIDDQVATFILQDESGPLITQYLAANPLVLDTISRLDPMSAAIQISSVIKPKADQLRPKTTNAPDPLEPLRGSGVPPKERGPSGATFE